MRIVNGLVLSPIMLMGAGCQAALLERSALAKNTAIQLVHGEPDSLEFMRDHLQRTTGYDVDVAAYRKILTL